MQGQRFRESCWSSHSPWFLKGTLFYWANVAAPVLPSDGVPRRTSRDSAVVTELAPQTGTAPLHWWWGPWGKKLSNAMKVVAKIFLFFKLRQWCFFLLQSQLKVLIPAAKGRRAAWSLANPSVRQHCFPAHCGHTQEIYCKSFQAISQAFTLGTGPTPKHQSVSDLQGLVPSRTCAKHVTYK